ncbi:hypothetical protein CDAR_556831 [Caerostris darwini]|uniref:Uncharacterized protein n=1 Tax=Caerostris darwini TaxID=1538125 RepID=A0AAV4RBC5_9ARAC|nr:hypothetical protein CDAR_556831 [Caerostris darwini]
MKSEKVQLKFQLEFGQPVHSRATPAKMKRPLSLPFVILRGRNLIRGIFLRFLCGGHLWFFMAQILSRLMRDERDGEKKERRIIVINSPSIHIFASRRQHSPGLNRSIHKEISPEKSSFKNCPR